MSGNGINAADVVWFVDKKSGDTFGQAEFERLQAAIFWKSAPWWSGDSTGCPANCGTVSA
ncbi:MAG: hypothetical protein R3C02_07740 [Planctomycetaceae bacterium]